MQTLQQLQRGELQGCHSLKLSEDLTSFPLEILDLADSLEVLDLSHNSLSSIPAEIVQLKKLKIAFFSYNKFSVFPNTLKGCKNLYMLGFKGNAISDFGEDILPLGISWLILTDNKLKKLPDSMGKLIKLQKFPIAGNALETLPSSMQNCKNLELIRLSANNLQKLPEWLLQLPKLSWLAFSGNPCAVKRKKSMVAEVVYDDLEVGASLGAGASGDIYEVYVKSLSQKGALKLFKGAITSDGYARDEIDAYTALQEHPNLIKVLAKLRDENCLGIVLELIPSRFTNLGNPPSFETCTRDTFAKGKSFSIDEVLKIARAMASASVHLHSASLMHGDLYAHNILVDEECNTYLGDFGAASFYTQDTELYEKIEVRAFGCLLEDLLKLCGDTHSETYAKIVSLQKICMDENILRRPLFSQMDL